METALAAIRFAHYIAAMFVFGAGFFLLAFTPRELRAALSPNIRGVAKVAGLIAFLSVLAWLALECASLSDDWRAAYDTSVVKAVLTTTSFGAVWQARIILAAVTIVALVATHAEDWGLSTLFGALLLASLSLVDHGAMQSGGLGVAHRVNDAVHLLTTGGWLGGLAPFVLCLRAAGVPEQSRYAEDAMLRFSAVGQFAVLTILLTGAANIYLTTHALPWPPASPYRALLTLKIGVVLTMIALALVNRYALIPTLDEHPEGVRALRFFALTELGLALFAVALVSYFGLLDPA